MGGRSRELRSLIAQFNPTVVVVSETTSTYTKILREAWTGAAIEEMPAVRKEWGSAPRAEMAMEIQPRFRYVVTQIYKDREKRDQWTDTGH